MGTLPPKITPSKPSIEKPTVKIKSNKITSYMNKHPLINEGETNKRKIEEEIKNNKQVKKRMNLKPPPTISDIKKTTTTKQNNRKEKKGKKKGRQEKGNEKTKKIAEPGIKQIKIT